MIATDLPFAKYFDLDGLPLDGGSIYIGQPQQNPETAPITAYWDAAGTQPALQPIKTVNGFIVHNGAIANLYTAGEYSITVRNRRGELVCYAPSSYDFDSGAILRKDLADSATTGKGAALIGFDATTLDQVLKSRLGRVVDSITALRALDKTKYTRAFTTGYYAAGDGGSSIYWYDSTDVASADNGGTVIVATDGGRWKLQVVGKISIKQFGAKGDNIADDTATIQAAITAVSASKAGLYAPGTPNGYKITAPLVFNARGISFCGDGAQMTKLIASGNFAAVLSFGAAALVNYISDLSIIQTGTTTKCVTIGRSTLLRFSGIEFLGNLAGDLVYSNGDNIDFQNCTFAPAAATTWAINFDTYNQNCGITNCIFSAGLGAGNGVRITNTVTPGLNRVEGLRMTGNWMTMTGNTSLDIGNSLYTSVVGNVFDQAALNAIKISATADLVQITGNWIGLAAGSAGYCINIDSTAGGGHTISNNILYGGSLGILISATAGARVSDVTITGNVFNNMANSALQLDAVNNCIITGNIDHSANPISGSWVTLATFVAGGTYLFANNKWHTNTIATFHAASSYRFGNEIGLKGRNTSFATSGAGATSLVINHGLITTPSKVLATPETNVGGHWISAKAPATFTITWITAGVSTFNWQAEL